MARRRKAVGSDAQAAILDMSERQKQRRMTEKQKKDAARVRAYYDLPEAVKQGVTKAAERQGLPASSVAAVLLADGLRRLEDGHISLYGLKRPSRSPLYEAVVEDEQVLKVLDGKKALNEG